MGTLDDAIREHLELKRRAGTSSEEVRRLESEALGPARRDAAPPAEDLEEREEPDEAEPPAPPRASEPEEPPAAVSMSDAPAPDPEGRRADPGWLDEDPFGDGEADDARAREEPGDAEPRRAPAEDETPSEDLLEETPDFLQETPEHDRLWFEQKPPRDFDFDE